MGVRGFEMGIWLRGCVRVSLKMTFDIRIRNGVRPRDWKNPQPPTIGDDAPFYTPPKGGVNGIFLIKDKILGCL